MATSERGGAGNGGGDGLSRRDAARVLAAAAGAGWLASISLAQQGAGTGPGRAQPQRPTRPGTRPGQSAPGAANPAQGPDANAPDAGKQPSFLDKLLIKGGEKSWTIRTIVHLDSYQNVVRNPQPGGAAPTGPGAGVPLGPGGSQPYLPEIQPFKFETAALVFPCLAGTAASSTDLENIKGKLTFDGKDVTGQPTVLDGLSCGSRYQRWDMRDKAGRQIDFEVELPVTCWEVKADEAVAAKAVWPQGGRWPADAQSTFTDGAGSTIAPALPGAEVQSALKSWTGGKPPTEVKPWELARFLAGKVLETVQPSGDGLVSSQSGLLQGFVLQGAEKTLSTRRGSEHDIACLLAAVYRAAGLPARTVIGYDVTKTKGDDKGFTGRSGSGSLRSWVEFCLYDEPAQASLWVPVDVVRQRRSGNVAPTGGRPWRFFGSNDETDDVIPLAFHYHPPTTVMAHGSPCLWGWLTTPEVQRAEQTVRFIVNTAVKRGGMPPGKGPGRR